MTKEVVKYHNQLNSVSMRTWTSEEMNFFFAILTKAREKGLETLVFETAELKELSQFADKHNQRWEQTLENAAKKIGQLTYWERTESKFTVMTLFKEFSVDFNSRIVTVEVSEKFEYILNKLQANFTVWELKEFTEIRSIYAKTMYRLLKQYRTLGNLKIEMPALKHILGIAKSYKATDIDKRVLQPIQEELSPFFEGLKITKIKAKTRGNPVIALELTFKPEAAKKKKVEEINKPQEALKSASNQAPALFYNWLEN